MPPIVKKGVSTTILSFLGSSVILGIASYFVKDTLDRVNITIDKVNARDAKMVHFEDTMVNLNNQLIKLDKTVKQTSKVLDNYTRLHAQNLANMTVSMTRVTEKIINLDKRCDRAEKYIDRLHDVDLEDER